VRVCLCRPANNEQRIKLVRHNSRIKSHLISEGTRRSRRAHLSETVDVFLSCDISACQASRFLVVRLPFAELLFFLYFFSLCVAAWCVVTYRQVRRYAQSFIQPGIKLVDMCEKLEECNRRLVKENGLQVRTLGSTCSFCELSRISCCSVLSCPVLVVVLSCPVLY
jgi:hypothetical protein